jgi:hypothetical protein
VRRGGAGARGTRTTGPHDIIRKADHRCNAASVHAKAQKRDVECCCGAQSHAAISTRRNDSVFVQSCRIKTGYGGGMRCAVQRLEKS